MTRRIKAGRRGLPRGEENKDILIRIKSAIKRQYGSAHWYVSRKLACRPLLSLTVFHQANKQGYKLDNIYCYHWPCLVRLSCPNLADGEDEQPIQPISGLSFRPYSPSIRRYSP